MGVSKTKNLEVNSICVARRPGEAIGGICRLENKSGEVLTVSVEYNQLDPLL